jgi:pimeloyl-ACP methyl ester carboxylesterase
MLTDIQLASAGDAFPAGVQRLAYRSGLDGLDDWAMLWPPATESQRPGTWLVVIHGHRSHGDQIFTRPDIREHWLPLAPEHGLGLISPNLRGNAWMSPAAAADLRGLLGFVRERFGAKRFVLASGSMGGTSNLVYAALQPEDVAGVVALGAAVDLERYVAWCREPISGRPAVTRDIADAIEQNYGPDAASAYARHSPLRHFERLTMPVFLAHGEADALMPIEPVRAFADAMRGHTRFRFRELPGGHHDSPLWLMGEALEWVLGHIRG